MFDKNAHGRILGPVLTPFGAHQRLDLEELRSPIDGVDAGLPRLPVTQASPKERSGALAVVGAR